MLGLVVEGRNRQEQFGNAPCVGYLGPWGGGPHLEPSYSARLLSQEACCHMEAVTKELPKIKAHKTDPNILCSLLSGLLKKGLQF